MQMQRLQSIAGRLLYPPKWILFPLPPAVFTALVYIFLTGQDSSALAYPVYGLSAYSLTILLAALPKWVSRIQTALRSSRTVQKLASLQIVGRYRYDGAFREDVRIGQGMAANLFYVVFRTVTGIRYASVWFISMAAYYLVLGGLRAYLLLCHRRRSAATACRCYRRTAWLLFLLNLPMGGMILQMVRTDAGYSYPGYVIYLSALYTFYTVTAAIINLVKFRRRGNPILSAAGVLNFISAMMAILGLQTAMISRFSENSEGFRRTMNAITGGAVYGIVIATAVYMLLHSRTQQRREKTLE